MALATKYRLILNAGALNFAVTPHPLDFPSSPFADLLLSSWAVTCVCMRGLFLPESLLCRHGILISAKILCNVLLSSSAREFLLVIIYSVSSKQKFRSHNPVASHLRPGSHAADTRACLPEAFLARCCCPRGEGPLCVPPVHSPSFLRGPAWTRVCVLPLQGMVRSIAEGRRLLGSRGLKGSVRTA